MKRLNPLFRYLGNRHLLAVLVVAVLAFGGAASLRSDDSSAHAGMDYSIPAADETLTVAPDHVEIWFTQELDQSGLIIAVLGPEGGRIDNEDASVDLCEPSRKRAVVTLPANLPDGTYIVQWQTLSAEDGEEDSGSFEFTLVSAAGSPAASPQASPFASPQASPEISCA